MEKVITGRNIFILLSEYNSLAKITIKEQMTFKNWVNIKIALCWKTYSQFNKDGSVVVILFSRALWSFQIVVIFRKLRFGQKLQIIHIWKMFFDHQWMAFYINNIRKKNVRQKSVRTNYSQSLKKFPNITLFKVNKLTVWKIFRISAERILCGVSKLPEEKYKWIKLSFNRM